MLEEDLRHGIKYPHAGRSSVYLCICNIPTLRYHIMPPIHLFEIWYDCLDLILYKISPTHAQPATYPMLEADDEYLDAEMKGMCCIRSCAVNSTTIEHLPLSEPY